jgi:hypothetical protein
MDGERVELGVHWKEEIKRLVELLLTTEDLRAVQRLTVEVQRAMYLRLEELQRQLAETRVGGPSDGSVVEIGLNNSPSPKSNEED